MVQDQHDSLDGWIALGLAQLAEGDPIKAIPSFRKALALCPDHIEAHVFLGRALHLVGDITSAWDAFRWEFQPHLAEWRVFEQPQWDGSDIGGRTVLLWSNGALGDTLHFVRYAAIAAECGARVVVECAAPLVPLLARISKVHRAVARGSPLPSFDYHAPMGLLPSLPCCRTLRFTVPYLSVHQRLILKWQRLLGPHDHITIGIAWGCKYRLTRISERSAPLAAFAPLARRPNLRLVSLQLGSHASELSAQPHTVRIDRLLTESSSISDTAALILNLDLVISVDTMVAHLAGALARPVWTLLGHVPDWRWQSEGGSTYWYPTMRLFRQDRVGDWSGVVERVRDSLDSLVQTV
jgi:hypothetical protein